MKHVFVLITLIATATILAGCSSTPTGGSDIAGSTSTIRAHAEYRTSWSPGFGCYTMVSGYAFNAGNTTMENVRLNFNLMDIKTGTIRDSRSIFVGALAPGESRTFESALDGECTADYRVDGAILS